MPWAATAWRSISPLPSRGQGRALFCQEEPRWRGSGKDVGEALANAGSRAMFPPAHDGRVGGAHPNNPPQYFLCEKILGTPGVASRFAVQTPPAGPERSLYTRGGPHDFAHSANSWGTRAAAGWGLQGVLEGLGARQGVIRIQTVLGAQPPGRVAENPCDRPRAEKHPPPSYPQPASPPTHLP